MEKDDGREREREKDRETESESRESILSASFDEDYDDIFTGDQDQHRSANLKNNQSYCFLD